MPDNPPKSLIEMIEEAARQPTPSEGLTMGSTDPGLPPNRDRLPQPADKAARPRKDRPEALGLDQGDPTFPAYLYPLRGPESVNPTHREDFVALLRKAWRRKSPAD
jgi:hypothetical protein